MPEDSSVIQLFNQSDSNLPLELRDIRVITSLVAKEEECQFSLLEVVYVDEEEIIHINNEHLDRDYITDIITFRYDEEDTDQNIEGTLFCCLPRIYEQALELNQEVEKEFQRIVVHGLLHLCGYTDGSQKDKQEMTEREDFYLEKLGR